MGAPAAVLAWVLSLAPALSAFSAADPLAGSSRVALALLPFAALAGLPPGRGEHAPAAASARVAGLLAPPLAIAWQLDRATGRELSELAWTAAAGVLATLLLALAASLASASPRARAVHGAAWLAAVAVGPLLAVQLGRATLGGPLGWLLARAAADPPPAAGSPYAAVAVCAALVLVAGAAAHRSRSFPSSPSSPSSLGGEP